VPGVKPPEGRSEWNTLVVWPSVSYRLCHGCSGAEAVEKTDAPSHRHGVRGRGQAGRGQVGRGQVRRVSGP